jgi:hypothetical protein
MTAEPCPACGAPPAAPLGAPFVGTTGPLWRRRPFEERLYRCAEGHVYSVRVESGSGGENVSLEVWEDVDEWLRERAGIEASHRPPGL